MKLLVFKYSGFCQFFQGDAHNNGIETPVEYQTSFSCVGRLAGYYADINSGCQVSFSRVPVIVPEVPTSLTQMASTCYHPVPSELESEFRSRHG
jgi:hypothetical protein